MKESLEEWLRRLADEEMPALGSTVRAIAEMSGDDDQKYIHQLADIIHQDAGMTMHVLRLTNGAYHIPRTKKFNTVNRALVMLGFNEVRSLCLTVAVVGKLLKGEQKAQLTKEMARAFHAAVQARSLAFKRGDTAAEEVFTSALLYRLGEMAFWCFGGDLREKLLEEMNAGVLSPEEAQKKVLGFELKELTKGLCEAWGIGPMLNKAISEAGDKESRWSVIDLTHQLALAVEQGWNSPDVERLLDDIADYGNIRRDQVRNLLAENAEEAIKVAKGFGVRLTGDSIPVPSGSDTYPTVTDIEDERAGDAAPVRFDFLNPDPMVQLNTLRDISARLESGTDVNEILELILEGIYCGIGMDRALFALLSPNRKYLRAKTARGASTHLLMNGFRFEVTHDKPNIFHFVIESQSALWVPDRSAAAIQKLIPDNVERIIGNSPFFIAPTIVEGKPIGVFFADRHDSGRELTHEDYEAFKQFAIQADLALAHLDRLQHKSLDV